jgi:hypothetical protein
VLVVGVGTWSVVELGAGDVDVLVDESAGGVGGLVEVVSVVVDVVGGGVVSVVGWVDVVGVVAPDTVPVAVDTTPLVVVVTVCVVVDVVEPTSVPVVVWPRRASAEGAETRRPSSVPTIAIATMVPLPISRLRIPDIPCVGRLSGHLPPSGHKKPEIG